MLKSLRPRFVGFSAAYSQPHASAGQRTQTKINHVSFEAVEKFKKHCLDGNVTIPTLRKILITLGAVLTYAVRMRYIDYNPCREVEKPKGQSAHSDKEEKVILQPDTIPALFDAAANQKERALFMTAVFTGMREGELLGLQWGDIDWHNGQIHVRRTFNHGRFYEPKSKASRRKIDLAPELVAELKKWKLACPISDLDLVFPSEVDPTGRNQHAQEAVLSGIEKGRDRAAKNQVSRSQAYLCRLAHRSRGISQIHPGAVGP